MERHEGKGRKGRRLPMGVGDAAQLIAPLLPVGLSVGLWVLLTHFFQ